VVIADADSAVATLVAHLLASAFDAPIVKQRLKQDFEVYVSGELCFENVLAAEMLSIPVQIDTLHDEISHESVVAVITASGLMDNDQRVKNLLKNDVPLLVLGDFHPNSVDFGNFSERVAEQPFALALTDAAYELGKFIINSVAPCTT
jgi:5-methylthioribose kinase